MPSEILQCDHLCLSFGETAILHFLSNNARRGSFKKWQVQPHIMYVVTVNVQRISVVTKTKNRIRCQSTLFSSLMAMRLSSHFTSRCKISRGADLRLPDLLPTTRRVFHFLHQGSHDNCISTVMCCPCCVLFLQRRSVSMSCQWHDHPSPIRLTVMEWRQADMMMTPMIWFTECPPSSRHGSWACREGGVHFDPGCLRQRRPWVLDSLPKKSIGATPKTGKNWGLTGIWNCLGPIRQGYPSTFCVPVLLYPQCTINFLVTRSNQYYGVEVK